MCGRRRILTAVVVVAISVATPAAVVTAKAKSLVRPATTSSSFVVWASNGYLVSVRAIRTGEGGPAKVSVGAVRERGKAQLTSVEYSTHGRLGKNGGVDAKLPGLGRLTVEFEQTKVEKSRFSGPPNCSGWPQLIRHGIFRGSIMLRGEGGFTVVHRHSAPGVVKETFPRTCPEAEGEEPSATRGTPGNQSIFASGPSSGGIILFSAAGPRPIAGAPESGLPTVEFDLSYTSKRGGVQIAARAVATSGSDRFSVAAPAGTPTDATVEPPAPFEGGAVFHLDSPTTGSWAGDLRATLPGIGPVAVSGPGIWATLCEGTTCTETLPASVG